MTRFTLRTKPPTIRNPEFLAARPSPSEAAPARPSLLPRAARSVAAARRIRAPTTTGTFAHSTIESRLAAIAATLGADYEEWVRELCERLDRRGQRNAAVRAAAALVREDSPSATAKALEIELRSYLSRAWPRESGPVAPEPDCSALRRNLWRIGKLTDGAGLGWRTILDLIEN